MLEERVRFGEEGLCSEMGSSGITKGWFSEFQWVFLGLVAGPLALRVARLGGDIGVEIAAKETL